MSHLVKNKLQEKDTTKLEALSLNIDVTRTSELTIKVSYKSRHTRQLVTLVNPTEEHITRLEMSGHDLILDLVTLQGESLKRIERRY